MGSVADWRQESPGTLCDVVIDRFLGGGGSDDDVAVLAFQLTVDAKD